MSLGERHCVCVNVCVIQLECVFNVSIQPNWGVFLYVCGTYMHSAEKKHVHGMCITLSVRVVFISSPLRIKHFD